MLFRRTPRDPARAALLVGFLPVAHAVEEGQRELLRAVPTSRGQGLSTTVAIDGFLAHLDEADRALVQWQAPSHLIERCRIAIGTARSEAAKLRTMSNGLAFEALNAAIGDVLFPLGTVVDVAAEMRERPRR